jgi:hypothetical protein
MSARLRLTDRRFGGSGFHRAADGPCAVLVAALLSVRPAFVAVLIAAFVATAFVATVLVTAFLVATVLVAGAESVRCGPTGVPAVPRPGAVAGLPAARVDADTHAARPDDLA